MVVRVPCISPDVLRLCSQAPAVLPKPRRGQLDLAAHRGKFSSQEYSVADNKDPNQKQPGEKEPGKFHYNPGNMSGKTADSCKDESEQRANVDRIRSRKEEVRSRDE
jgi:hypothetical protein